MTRCIGFGMKDGVCANDAGSTHSELWCQECDDERRAHINGQLQKIAERFEELPATKRMRIRPVLAHYLDRMAMIDHPITEELKRDVILVLADETMRDVLPHVYFEAEMLFGEIGR